MKTFMKELTSLRRLVTYDSIIRLGHRIKSFGHIRERRKIMAHEIGGHSPLIESLEMRRLLAAVPANFSAAIDHEAGTIVLSWKNSDQVGR